MVGELIFAQTSTLTYCLILHTTGPVRSTPSLTLSYLFARSRHKFSLLVFSAAPDTGRIPFTFRLVARLGFKPVINNYIKGLATETGTRPGMVTLYICAKAESDTAYPFSYTGRTFHFCFRLSSLH